MSITSTSVLDHLDSVGTIAAGLFAGTALYISIGEVPSMRMFGLEEHWRYFPYMYNRAAPPQIAFAAVACAASIAHGTRIIGAKFDRNLWIGAGTIFLGMLPYTVICLFPTNHLIINDNKKVTLGQESQFSATQKKELLDKWAVLHFVRTVGSVVGFGAMIYGLSRHTSLVLKW
jgi:hypothetical protein